MGLDIWFVEDIRNAILAANEASSATAKMAGDESAVVLDVVATKLREVVPQGPNQVLLNILHLAAVGNTNKLRDYRAGYNAALVTLALAFGLSPAIVKGQPLPSEADAVQVVEKGAGK